MKKLTNERRLELLTILKPYFGRNSTAYCSIKNVSNSGMYRHIQILGVRKNRVHNLSYYVAELCGFSFKDKTCSVGVSGCGMDMGFHVVSTMSHYLYPNKKRGEYIVKHQWV